MKIKIFGWEYIKCPTCGEEQHLPPNVYEAICTCGAKYIGRGIWLTVKDQIKPYC